jgi:hypothetical protein
MSDSVVMSTASAPTTTAPTVDTIEVGSGEAVTFDDLERVEAQSKAAKRHEKNETKEVVKETVKALDKAKEGKDDKDSKKSKAEDKEAEEGKEKDSKEAGAEKAEGKVDSDKGRGKLKAKLGDKEIELEPDTLVPVKINGKEEYISLKDLQSQHSGRVAYDKKFQEMDVQRRTFESKMKAANDKITSIFEEPDPEIRFYKMAELSGKEPVEVYQKFLADNLELLEKYYGMSDDERKVDAIAYENKILKHRQESQTKMEAQRKSEQDLSAKIAGLEKTHNLKSEEFWNHYDQIAELQKAGKLVGSDGKPIKVTPEFVAESVVKERLWNSAASVLDNSQLDLPIDKRAEALSDLVDACFAQGLSTKDVSEIADGLWGKGSKISAVEEKIQEQEELRTGKKSSVQAKKQDSGPVFFDELY